MVRLRDEAAGGWSRRYRREVMMVGEGADPGLLAVEVEGCHLLLVFRAAAAEGDELGGADEVRAGGAGGVEGGEFEALAAVVGLEVEEEDTGRLLGDVEVALGGGGDLDEVFGADDAGGLDGEVLGAAGRGVIGEAEEVDLDLRGFRRGEARPELKAGGVDRGCCGCSSMGRLGWGIGDGFNGDEITGGGDGDVADGAVQLDKGLLLKGLAGGEVGKGVDEGELAADAEDEAAMADGPEIAAVVSLTPGGAGEDLAGGELKQDGGYVLVLVGLLCVGHAGEQAAAGEGGEQVSVVDEVEGEDGVAEQEVTIGDGLIAEIFQWEVEDGSGWFGGAGEWSAEGQKDGEEGGEKLLEARNRHGSECVRNGAGERRVEFNPVCLRVLDSTVS